MDISAQALRDRLRGALLAAAATPMTASGEVDLGVVSRYFAGLVEDGVDGLAVLAHTGRGPYLAPDVRAAVIERAVALGVPVLVGVGGSSEPSGTPNASGSSEPSDASEPPGAAGRFARAAEEARVAASLGAHGVLVFPAEGDRLGGHDAIWRAARLPMIAFDLYTRPCPPDTMLDLLRHPGVAGLKTALLSDAMGCQRAISLARQEGRLAITGEDRMFGPSLLWGAEAALVGLAAASVGVTAAVMDAYRGSDLRAFDAASARLDRLATATFTEPMEGYVQRMLWLAAAEGRIPESHAHDPYGPSLPEQERARVMSTVVSTGGFAAR
ncbi:dihydrodipicolinate synthase family protein [Nonomuraea sp. NEAU-A123]|uniref:dihydrodipicolinate synthase family protein n=1 Tax=Nonomuraea sp. NEAU-A123 TaxID=2839649 RepID=UPI001BE4531F|nr:dihydrodipicolinate synthase family protein [Nonomuraea sp. NEAU-A123]MBT2227198.1 dihydrodipicolinate synthase family protein [Nonomuraea sp. NEAU-A123]